MHMMHQNQTLHQPYAPGNMKIMSSRNLPNQRPSPPPSARLLSEYISMEAINRELVLEDSSLGDQMASASEAKGFATRMQKPK